MNDLIYLCDILFFPLLKELLDGLPFTIVYEDKGTYRIKKG